MQYDPEQLEDTMEQDKICWACDGSGEGYSDVSTCLQCRGVGTIPNENENENGDGEECGELSRAALQQLDFF